MQPDRYRLGYGRVDRNPDVSVLLDSMDATGRWPATVALRSWEREHLRLRPGERLLDVGCGLGDAALALADALGPHGALVGVDASESMLAVARQRARAAGCPAEFVVGDARQLDQPDSSFDAARCERTLQWLADPQLAVLELARVLKPGGRLCLIDTDWSTLHLDVGDADIATRVRMSMSTERNRASHVGARLDTLAEAARLDVVGRTNATHTWDDWDPDVEPAPTGCFSMVSLAEDLVATHQLDPHEAAPFVTTVHQAARAGRFHLSLTMFAIAATG